MQPGPAEADNAPSEVLPERGIVYSLNKELMPILCKPKLLPVKSYALERLEKLEKKMQEDLKAQREARKAQRSVPAWNTSGAPDRGAARPAKREGPKVVAPGEEAAAAPPAPVPPPVAAAAAVEEEAALAVPTPVSAPLPAVPVPGPALAPTASAPPPQEEEEVHTPALGGGASSADVSGPTSATSDRPLSDVNVKQGSSDFI